MSIFKQSTNKKDIEIESRTVEHEGFCHVEKFNLKQRLFDGGWSASYSRELLVKHYAVAVLPYDPVLDKVVLIEQFRTGAMLDSDNPWLIEIVAGIKDGGDDESNEELIKRELWEEAGLEAEEFFPVYEYFVTPGCSTEKVNLCCAKVDSTKAPKFSGLKEEHEDIKVHVVLTEDAFAAVRSGEINNAFTIIALQWLELNLEKMQKIWDFS